MPSGCDTALGLKASKMSATLKLEHTDKGSSRYDTMTAMRAEIDAIVPPAADGESDAFPFSFEFLYWEENGVIDVELTRNLAICAAVVLAIIFLMIPRPKIAVWVALCVILSVMDLIGFLYWWGVTISGTSTIYILISVGLAVDYSAHIAHAFTTASGNAPTRAVKAVRRLGPSVFNAVVSTGLAVALIGFSKSWVFVIFFRALFLVCILGGAHGLWLLPVLLSIAGGERQRNDGGESDDDGLEAGKGGGGGGGDRSGNKEDDDGGGTATAKTYAVHPTTDGAAAARTAVKEDAYGVKRLVTVQPDDVAVNTSSAVTET